MSTIEKNDMGYEANFTLCETNILMHLLDECIMNPNVDERIKKIAFHAAMRMNFEKLPIDELNLYVWFELHWNEEDEEEYNSYIISLSME